MYCPSNIVTVHPHSAIATNAECVALSLVMTNEKLLRLLLPWSFVTVMTLDERLLKKAAAYFARSRCSVRDDEEYAASISGADDVPSLSGICWRLLRLVGETAIEASP